ncbi:hypothetical protein KJ632_05135 [Patescibacteria group bacterium]|nr:hypothetical protein [Patescibacteria group bacterium]
MFKKALTKRILIIVIAALCLAIIAPGLQDVFNSSGELLSAHTAHAAGLSDTQAESFEKINRLTDALSRVIWPVLYMIGGLLDGSIIFDGGMEERLRDIWIPIRNIVNIFFVLAIVGIALYNILGFAGGEGDEYTIKTMLPKIIIGIIAVNFSFLGIKIALDFVNILTTSIVAIPAGISEELMDTKLNDKDKQTAICLHSVNLSPEMVSDGGENGTIKKSNVSGIYNKTCMLRAADELNIPGYNGEIKDIAENDEAGIRQAIESKIDSSSLGAEEKTAMKEEFNEKSQECQDSALCNFGTLELTGRGRAFFESLTQKNIAMALALNMGNILEFKMAPMTTWATLAENTGSVQLEESIINAIFSLVMFLLYTTAFIALAIILFGRVIVMWLSIAISPILLILFTVPAAKEMGGLGELTDKFTKHLFVPVPIALALMLGWVMFNAIIGQGSLSAGTDILSSTYGLPVKGLESFPRLVAAIGTVVVVWMGVFESAQGTVVEGVVGTLGEAVQGAGKWLGTAPFRFAKVIPVKTASGETVTASPLAAFQALSTGIPEHLKQQDLNEANELKKKMGLTINNLKNVATASTAKGAYNELKENASTFKGDKDTAYEVMKEIKGNKNKKTFLEDMAKEATYEQNPKLAESIRGFAKAEDATKEKEAITKMQEALSSEAKQQEEKEKAKEKENQTAAQTDQNVKNATAQIKGHVTNNNPTQLGEAIKQAQSKGVLSDLSEEKIKETFGEVGEKAIEILKPIGGVAALKIAGQKLTDVKDEVKGQTIHKVKDSSNQDIEVMKVGDAHYQVENGAVSKNPVKLASGQTPDDSNKTGEIRDNGTVEEVTPTP